MPGSGSPRSYMYSGTSSDDGTVDSGSNLQRSEDHLSGGSAVASLRQKFTSNISDDLPPRPPPRETVDQTKVSSFTGVRLRRREQSNPMTESFYAAEHENNNAYTENTKLTSASLQNLEQQMPRRTRRSIGRRTASREGTLAMRATLRRTPVEGVANRAGACRLAHLRVTARPTKLSAPVACPPPATRGGPSLRIVAGATGYRRDLCMTSQRIR